jgi:hypothetical protein
VVARLALTLAWAAAAAHAEPKHVGSEACRPCHPQQFKTQSASGHANSLAPAAKHRLASLFPKLGFEPDWAFGAGDQAVTFVSQLDEKAYIEHRLSYYRRGGTLDVTPGHQNLEPGQPGEVYPIFEPEARIMRCFACHSTGPLSLGPRFQLQPFEPGVKCETCHGPGSDHVASRGRAPLRNPGRLTPAAMNEFCGSCHRKPGPPDAPVDLRDPWNVRHQPIYFERSRCFRKSGSLTCLSCHDPHSARPIDANQVCASCHPAARHPVVAVPLQDCAGCHMPAVSPHRRLTFRNHWIGVYSKGELFEPQR